MPELAILSDAQENEFVSFLQNNQNKSSFYKDLLNKYNKFGGLTQGQWDAVEKSIPREQAADLRALRLAKSGAVIIEGIHEITGTVLSLKAHDSRGLVFTIETDEELRLWGTVPADMREDVKVGSKVTFVAEILSSKPDPTFGFFKKPRAGMIL